MTDTNTKALEAENAELRKLLRESQHALWQFKSCGPANIDLLRRVADEWDCESGCEHVSTEWDTGAWTCSEEDREGCRHNDAEALRDLASAIETHESLLSASPPAEEGKSVRLTEDERETVEALHCDVLDHQRYLDRSAVRDVLAIIDRLAPLPSEGGEA